MAQNNGDRSILETIRASYEFAFNQKERLDDKLNNFSIMLGTITTLMIGIGSFVLEKVPPGNQMLQSLTVVMLLSVGLLLTGMIKAILNYRPMGYLYVPKDAPSFIQGYNGKSETEILRAIGGEMAEATKHNMEVNGIKARTLKWVFFFTILGILAMLMFFVLFAWALSIPIDP